MFIFYQVEWWVPEDRGAVYRKDFQDKVHASRIVAKLEADSKVKKITITKISARIENGEILWNRKIIEEI